MAVFRFVKPFDGDVRREFIGSNLKLLLFTVPTSLFSPATKGGTDSDDDHCQTCLILIISDTKVEFNLTI